MQHLLHVGSFNIRSSVRYRSIALVQILKQKHPNVVIRPIDNDAPLSGTSEEILGQVAYLLNTGIPFLLNRAAFIPAANRLGEMTKKLLEINILNDQDVMLLETIRTIN